MKASEVKGLLMEKKNFCQEDGDFPSIANTKIGYNRAIDEISSKEIVVDVEKMSKIIALESTILSDRTCKIVATALANSMREWLRCGGENVK